jgi:hypothetical protein
MSEPQLPQSFLRVLASLTEWFKDQQVSYAIIGGAAIGFLAQPRSTQDIDAVTWLDLAETAGFVKSGARFGFFPRMFVLMGTLETSTHPKVLANAGKHVAFTRCAESNLYGIVDSQIPVVESELLAGTVVS